MEIRGMNRIKEILSILNKERVITIDTKFLAMDIKTNMHMVCLFILQFIILFILIVVVALLLALHS